MRGEPCHFERALQLLRVEESQSAARGIAESVDEALGIEESQLAARGIAASEDEVLGIEESQSAARGIAESVDEALGIKSRNLRLVASQTAMANRAGSQLWKDRAGDAAVRDHGFGRAG